MVKNRFSSGMQASKNQGFPMENEILLVNRIFSKSSVELAAFNPKTGSAWGPGTVCSPGFSRFGGLTTTFLATFWPQRTTIGMLAPEIAQALCWPMAQRARVLAL
jgi:hypothetical protein